jgi:hypothetical protein
MDRKWAKYISFVESIVNMWHQQNSNFWVEDKRDTSKKFDCLFKNLRILWFVLQIEIGLHTSYVRFKTSDNLVKTSDNLVNVNLRTLAFAGFKMSRLAWNQLCPQHETFLSPFWQLESSGESQILEKNLQPYMQV